jgi:hypothetical protein
MKPAAADATSLVSYYHESPAADKASNVIFYQAILDFLQIMQSLQSATILELPADDTVSTVSYYQVIMGLGASCS